MIHISLVPADHVGHIWHIVEPMLSKAIDRSHGRDSIMHVFEDILSGAKTLWIAFDKEIIAAMTVSVNRYRTSLVTLDINYIGGSDASLWLTDKNAETLKSYARDNGCDMIEIHGRQGWGPMIKRLGYHPVAVGYELNLKEDDNG